MTDIPYSTDPNLRWIYPHEEPPPQGTKLALLTIGGMQVVGIWEPRSFVAWQHLFKRDHEVERSIANKIVTS